MEAEIAEEGGVVGSHVRASYIKKRALKNKAVSVSFNEKDLTDFVTGFHKRKKKRRKEAQHLQQEAERRKRIELRKKRKLEREYVIFGEGGAPTDADAGPNENGEDDEEDEMEPPASVSGITTYDNGDVKVLVTTSEISREEESLSTDGLPAAVPRLTTGSSKKHNVPVVKKKPFKQVTKRRSGPKQQTKRDKRKGKSKSRE